MCIICVKPAGEAFPSKKLIKRMFTRNPDGAGFMYADGEKVTIKKGMMDYSTFMSEYAKIKRDFGKTYVFHFRITTHGGTTPAMCQPFPLSNSVRHLKRLNTSCDVGIAHNGIIDMTMDARNISDTALFIKRYATKILAQGIDEYALDIINECISGSRFCILEKNGKYHLIGKWYEENGLYFSNSGFKSTYDSPRVSNSNTFNFSDWIKESYTEPYCSGDCENCKRQVDCYGYELYSPNSGAGNIYSTY